MNVFFTYQSVTLDLNSVHFCCHNFLKDFSLGEFKLSSLCLMALVLKPFEALMITSN